MKKKKSNIVFLIIGIILILLLLFLFIGKKPVNEEFYEDNSPYLFVTYKNDLGNACITFYDDGVYSMFDCDSEPTNYPFDSENNCTFKYDKENKNIQFKCLNNLYDKDEFNVKVNKWTYDELSFVFEDEEELFKRDTEFLDGEPISRILTLDRCYTSKNNTLCLNSDGTFDHKVCDKTCLKYKGVGDHADNSILFYYNSVEDEKGKVKKIDKSFEGKVTADNEVTIDNDVYKIEKTE